MYMYTFLSGEVLKSIITHFKSIIENQISKVNYNPQVLGSLGLPPQKL